MADDIVQVIQDAREDAVSLSQFIYYPASTMVERRLAPSIHTLNYYLDYLHGLELIYSQESGTVTVNGEEVKTVRQAINDSIDSVILGDYQTTLESEIDNEVVRATNREDEIEGALDAEVIRASNAESNITQDLSDLNLVVDAQKLDTGIIVTPKYPTYTEQFLSQTLKNYVSIENFGASSESGFDNTFAIQAALNSGAKAILIPANTYEKSGNITIPSDVTIFGYGKGSEILDTRLSAGEGFTINGNNISLVNFSLNSVHNGSYLSGSIAVRASSTGVTYDSILVESLHINGWGTGGVLLSRCNNSNVNYCKVTKSGRYGVFILGSVNTHLLGNTIKDITVGSGGNAPFINAYGFSFTSDISEVGFPACSNCTAYFNYIENIPNWEGMDIHGCDDITIAYNTVKNTFIGCYVGAATGLNNRTSNRIIVSNNKFTTATTLRRPAIIVSPTYSVGTTYGNDIKITDNFIYGYGLNAATIAAGYSSTEGAIHIIGVIGCDVSNNYLSNCGQIGIYIRQSSLGIKISNNRIRDVKTISDINWCIAVEDITNTTVTVENNYMQRSTGVVNGITTFNNSTTSGAGTVGLTLGFNTFLGISQKFGTHLRKHLNYVSPDTLINKCVAYITNTGATTVARNINVLSAERVSTGVVEITFSLPLADSQPVIIATPQHNTLAYCVVNAGNSNTFRVYTYNSSGTLADINFFTVVS